MRVAVVGNAEHTNSSRDPATVVRGLCTRGHDAHQFDVLPSLPLPKVRDLRGHMGTAELPPEVVLALGVDAALAGSVLARRSSAPLVLSLRPTDLPPLVEHDATELVLRHLPIAAVLVESARGRALAASIGAELSRTMVIAPGIPLAQFSGKLTPPQRPTHPTILAELTSASPGERALVEDVLERITTEVGVAVHRLTEGQTVSSGQMWTLVVVPGCGSDPTLPLLRAMAAGLPVLTSDTALGAEVLTSMRHGLMAAADDADEWVEKVRYIVADSALQAHLGRGARAHAMANGGIERTISCVDDCLRGVMGAWNPDPLPVSTPLGERAM